MRTGFGLPSFADKSLASSAGRKQLGFFAQAQEI